MTPSMRGFTLVELMIALVLGLLIVLAIGTVFNQSSDNYRQDERLSSLQDNLRFAMAQLTSDLEMTGFWSELHDPAAVDVSDPSLGISTDCGPAVGWAWDLLTALEAADNGDADVINSTSFSFATPSDSDVANCFEVGVGVWERVQGGIPLCSAGCKHSLYRLWVVTCASWSSSLSGGDLHRAAAVQRLAIRAV